MGDRITERDISDGERFSEIHCIKTEIPLFFKWYELTAFSTASLDGLDIECLSFFPNDRSRTCILEFLFE